jgi:hypothetical protein
LKFCGRISNGHHLRRHSSRTAGHPARGVARIRVMMVLFACLASVTSSMARAEGNIHIGQLHVHPFVSAGDTFSDNIYFTSTEEKRDSFATYTPGIKLQFPFGQDQAEAQYFAVLNRYATFKGEDTTDHNASGSGDFKFGRFFGARLSEVFVKGHEPRSSSATGFIEVFRHNTATAAATYQLATRSKLEFDFGKSTWGFVQSPFRDRDEGLFSGYLYYRFLPRTSAFIEFDHKKVTFVDQSLGLDNDASSELFGVTWEITEKSKGTIKAGSSQKVFRSAAVPDFKTWIGSIDFHHQFTDDVSMMLLAERTVNETNVFGTDYFVTTGGYGEFSYKFFRKLAAVVHGSYGIDEFSNSTAPGLLPVRQDRTTRGGGGLKYFIGDSFEIAADYSHGIRDSNIAVDSYNEHAYMVSVSMEM